MTRLRLFALPLLLSFALGTSALVAAQDDDERTTDETVSPDQPQSAQEQTVPPQIFMRPGTVITPASSVVRPEDAGLRAHTNHLIFVPAGHPLSSPLPDYTSAETPASMGCVYKVGPIYAGCNPATGGTNHPTGGWGAIALVDAYDNPNAASDLAAFSSHYGLPARQPSPRSMPIPPSVR